MRILKNHPLLKLINSYLVDSPQPANLSYLWNFGSLLALCLVIQIITGVTLAMHYNANVIEAFDSVEHVMRDVNNGWFLRYLHSNTASAFFFIVYLHIGRGLYYGSYRAPRTLVWTIGTVIFILMMATAFLGYVLPYGQMSLWGATVITNLMSAIPWIGQDIVEFIWGGFSVNNATLNRFFALHYVLPFVLAALALMHLVALHDSAGSGNPVGVSGNIDRLAFAPYFIFKDLITIYLFIIILSVFVFFMPNALGDSENYVMANPMQTPPAIVPEWYLLPFYAILRSIPNKLLGVIAMFLAILILLALPFTDLSRSRGIQFRPLSKITFFIFLANFLILMKLGAKHVESPFIEFGQLSTIIFFSYFLIIIPFFSLFENSLLELSSLKYKSLFTNIDVNKDSLKKLLNMRIILNYLMLYLLSYMITVILVYYGCFDTFFCTYEWYICVDPENEAAKPSKTGTKGKKKVVEQNEEVVDLTKKPTTKAKAKRKTAAANTDKNEEVIDLTKKPTPRKRKTAAANTDKEVVDLTKKPTPRKRKTVTTKANTIKIADDLSKLKGQKKVSMENKKIVDLTNSKRPHEKTKAQRINEAKQEIRNLIKPYQKEVKKIMSYYCKAIVRHRIALSMEGGFTAAQEFDQVKAENKWKRLKHEQITPYKIHHRIRKYKHKARAAFKKAVFHSEKEIRLLRQLIHSQQTLAKAGAKDCPVIPHCPYPYFIAEEIKNPYKKDGSDNPLYEKSRLLDEKVKKILDERAKKFHLNPEEEFVPTSKKKEAIPEPQPKKKSRKYKKEKSPEPVIVNLPTFAKKLMDEYERNKLLQIHLDQANNQIKLLQYEIEKLKKPHDKELKKEINKKMNKLKDYTKYPEGLYGDSLDFTKKNRAVMESNKFFVNNENKNGKQDKIIDSIRANSTNLDTNSTFIDYTSNTVLHDYIHTSRSSVEPYDPFIRASNTNLQHSRSGINSSSNVQQPRLPSPQLTNFRSGDGYVLPPIISNPSNNNVMDFSNVGQFDYPDRSVLPPIISNRSPDRSVLPSNLSNNNVMDFSNVGQFDYPDRSVLPPIISNPSNNNVMDFSNVGQFDSPNRSVLPSNPSNNNVIDFSNVHLFPADTTLNTTTVKGPIRDSDWSGLSDKYDSTELNDFIRKNPKLRSMAEVSSSSSSESDSDNSYKSWRSDYFNQHESATRIANSQPTEKAWKIFSNVKHSDIPDAIKRFETWFNSDEQKYKKLPETSKASATTQTTAVAEANTSSSRNKRKRPTTSNVSGVLKNTTAVAETNPSTSKSKKKRVRIIEPSSSWTQIRTVRSSNVSNSRAVPTAVTETNPSPSITENRTISSSNVYRPTSDYNRTRNSSEEREQESLYSRDL